MTINYFRKHYGPPCKSFKLLVYHCWPFFFALPVTPANKRALPPQAMFCHPACIFHRQFPPRIRRFAKHVSPEQNTLGFPLKEL